MAAATRRWKPPWGDRGEANWNGGRRRVPVPFPDGSGRGEIAADALVHASPESVFEFLSDLDSHWRLAGPCIEILSLDGRPGVRDGGTVRVRGPLGLRRTATTRVLAASPPRQMVGRAEIGRRTKARVRWVLESRGQATAVRLSATIEGAGTLDGLLLRLGGRRWLRRLFIAALGRLADHFASRSSQVLGRQRAMSRAAAPTRA
ncbi:MAG: SRPBCC family protein [Gaiellaceae bacterium]